MALLMDTCSVLEGVTFWRRRLQSFGGCGIFGGHMQCCGGAWHFGGVLALYWRVWRIGGCGILERLVKGLTVRDYLSVSSMYRTFKNERSYKLRIHFTYTLDV